MSIAADHDNGLDPDNKAGIPDVSENTKREPSSRFAEQALARDKRESLDLAVKARWAALSIIAILLPIVNPTLEVIYYEILLLGFAAIGWAQHRIGRVGQSRAELLLMFCDLALMTLVLVAPNPFSALDWPMAMQYRFNNFMYFFVLLAGAVLAYSWRTVIAMGTWTAGLWMLGAFFAWLTSGRHPELSETVRQAFGHSERLVMFFDPNNIHLGIRIQEVVVFLIVAVTLALSVRRSSNLLIGHAALERERANLARYFSPNVVEELSNNDDPLKQVRNQDVAVLFVDIVGFTQYAAHRKPEQVIETLRAFHGRMETEVFRHHGTLDKYLGDGLMATFGTPSASALDATNALSCARAMAASVAQWNKDRVLKGEPAIQANFGLHYGPVVLGDIGANRLEFAVIGNTVNVASRLEVLTRELGVALVASDAMIVRVRHELGKAGAVVDGFSRKPDQIIRGVDEPMTVWTLDQDRSVS